MTKPNTPAPKGRKPKTMTEATTPAVEAAVEKTPRTLAELLVAAKERVAKLEAQINAENQINNVEVGDDVTFNYGRPIGTKVLTGKVVAVADDAIMGRTVAVQTGEGLDIAIVKSRAEHIIENRTAASRVAPDAPAEATNDDAPVDDADPLAAE